MSRFLIYIATSLFVSCSLLEKTPPSVIDGQLAIYQSILISKENDEIIINRYIQDCKAAVTYHINWVFESKINIIRENLDLSREEKSLQIAELERERESKINDAYVDIESNAEDMRSKVMSNHDISLRLVQSIYNYLSTTPIEVDIIPFLIEQLEKTEHLSNG